MDVILLERVAKLGQLGEVVSVKPGYARNFLFPQGKALRASQDNIARFEAQKEARAKRNEETRREAEAFAQEIDGRTFVLIRSASDAGALYGSVTPRDVAGVAAEDGVKIDRKQIIKRAPIKELGIHPMTLQLHPEVEAEIKVNVARSVEEAELQASGRTIHDAAAEEDAEAAFDIAELFDEVGAAAMDEDDVIRPSEDAGEQPDV